MSQPNIIIVILAAGASTRLGRPKQLLRDAQGQSLLRRALFAAQAATAQKILVVLGAHAASCRRELGEFDGARITVIENENWRAGLSASIAAAAEFLTQGDIATPDAALFMLCDQPAVGATHLQNTIDLFLHQGAQLIATGYAKRAGVPALFGRKFYSELKELIGDEGARELLKKHGAEVREIKLPTELQDIDTVADYEDFLQSELADALRDAP